MAPVNSTRIQQAIDYCLNKGGQISESAKRFGVPEKQLNYLVSEALNPFTGPSTNKELWDNFENTRVVKAKLVVGNQSYYLITTGFDSSEPKMTAYDTNGNAINVNTLKKTYGIADFQVSGNGEISLVAKQNSATNMHLELENDEDGYFDTLGEYKQEGMGALQENSFEVTQKTLYSEDLAKNPVKTPYENTLQQDAQIREQTIDLLINDTQNALAMLDDYRDSFGYVSWDAIAQGLEGIGNVTIDKITGSNLFVTVGENKEALEKQLKQLEKLKKQADNPETFAKQFKETFGVDYNPENFHNLTQTAAKYKEMNAYNSLSNYFGNGIEKLKSSDVSDFEAAGMLAPLFKGGVTEAQEYIKNIRQISKNDTEFKNNLISVLEESKKSIDSNLKGVDLQSLENAYRQRYKNAMGENTEEETIDGFINITKRNAMFTEVGVSIASGSLASSYGKLTSVIAGASPSAIESVADGATGGDGTLEEGLEKFKNNMAYGLFGAYVSGPLGTSVSKVLSSNGNVFKNIVSNHKFTMVAGTTAETTADVLFDNIMSDMSFRESLEQNGIMNFSMMFLGGAAHKTNNTVNPDLPNVDMSQIKIEKMSDGTFNLKADNKLFFKAKDEDELAMAVLSLGQNNEARKAHSSQQSTSEGTITHNTQKPGADNTTARTNTEHTTNTANSTTAVKPQNTAGDISAPKAEDTVTKRASSDSEIENTKPETSSAALDNISTKEDLAKYLEEYTEMDNAELTKLLSSYNEENIDSLKTVLKYIIDNGKSDNSQFAKMFLQQKISYALKSDFIKNPDNADFIKQFLSENTTDSKNILNETDHYDKTYILFDSNTAESAKALYELKNKTDNPLLNADNIMTLLDHGFKGKSPEFYNKFGDMLNLKDEQGNYVLNAKKFPLDNRKALEFVMQDPKLINKDVIYLLDSDIEIGSNSVSRKGIDVMSEIYSKNPDISVEELVAQTKERVIDKKITDPVLVEISNKYSSAELNNNLFDIQTIMKDVKDKNILEYVNNQLGEIKTSTLSQQELNAKITDIQDALDIYHSVNGDYVNIGDKNFEPYYRSFINYVKENNPTLANELMRKPSLIEKYLKTDQYKFLRQDFVNDMQFGKLADYCKKHPDSELSEYFYNNYFLKNVKLPKEVKQQCIEINNKYGVKVIPSSYTTESKEVFDYIDKEFTQWQTASGGNAKLPPVLDFMSTKQEYFDKTSAYGKTASGGFAEIYSNQSIALNGMTMESVQHAIRHELTHINDTKKGIDNLPQEIAPRKNGSGEIDFANCKYREEFLRGGIDPAHVSYAYNNPREFIAVAAEGDMSKYSPEFKKLLIDMGMPKWQFDMDVMNPSIKNQIELNQNSLSGQSGMTLEELYYGQKAGAGKTSATSQNAAGDTSASKTKEQTVPESEIVKTSSATIDKTQGITSTTLGETAKTTPKSSTGNVFVYNPTNNPNVKLKEYTYVLKSGRKLKLIGPEGLDQKNLQILINTDLNRRILQQQLPHFKEYSESTQIRLARLMTNCPPSLKPRLQNMLRTAIDETTCLKIINDKQALTQRLNDIKELEEFFKPNEFYYLEGLLEIKTSDPAKYQKIANSGIFELIKEGKVDASALNQLNKNSDLSVDVYNDLALVKSGKSIVPEFPEGTDLKTAFEQTSTGDAIEVGNKMYINDGNTLVEWNMTKEKYLELFPPVQRFTTTQSLTISNCHLIQTLGLAMHNPNARAQFLQSFELNGNDVVVTVKSLEDYNGSKTFTNGEIQLASQNKHLTGCKGLQMYEQTYSEKALREKELDPVADPDIASIDELMTRSAWGLPAQTMGDVFGQGSMCDILPIAKEIQDVNGKTEIKLASSYSTTVLSEIPYKDNSGIDTVDLNQQKTEGTKMYVFNKFFKDFPDKTLSLSNLSTETTETLLQNTANNPDFMISFGTILPSGTAAESKLLPEYNLISSHAYSIVGYDTINKTVKIANPHSYAAVTEIPLDTLQKYIGNLDFIKL